MAWLACLQAVIGSTVPFGVYLDKAAAFADNTGGSSVVPAFFIGKSREVTFAIEDFLSARVAEFSHYIFSNLVESYERLPM